MLALRIKEDIIRLPTSKFALGSILVFAIKVNQDGCFATSEVKLVKKGFTQMYCIAYGGFFSSCKMTSVHLRIFLVIIHNYP